MSDNIVPSPGGNAEEGVTTTGYPLNEKHADEPGTRTVQFRTWKCQTTPSGVDEIVYSVWRHTVLRYDGDLVMLTDNKVLVDKLRELPALMCAQRRAEKRVSSDEDFVRSNIESFGNDIGQTTNWITSMFEVRARYPDDSEERKALDYRIRCGQLYQQNAMNERRLAQ